VEAGFAFIKILIATPSIGILEDEVDMVDEGRKIVRDSIGGQGLEQGHMLALGFLPQGINGRTPLVNGPDFFFKFGRHIRDLFQFQREFVGLLVIGSRASP
jgi:hypothetical protein